MQQQFEHTIGTVSMQALSTPGSPGWKHPGDVNFKVEYAAEFTGEKTLPEGEVLVVSKECAEQFTAAGFGHVVTEEVKQSAEVQPAATAEGEKPAADPAEPVQEIAEQDEEPAATAEGEKPAKKSGGKKAKAE